MTKTHPSRPRTSSPPEPTAADDTPLYGLGIQVQAIQHEISEAAEMLVSEDPAEVEAGVALMEELLAAEDSTRGALLVKTDRVLAYADGLMARASALRQRSKAMAELAAKDEQRIEKLHGYLFGVLEKLYPNQTRIDTPTHELTSRRSSAVVFDDDFCAPSLPAALKRIKITAELIDPELNLLEIAGLVVHSIDHIPLKEPIKQALKAGACIPGATIQDKRNWKVQ